ncbi:ABC transporter substrate-binding protein [Knoellia sp. p5-6-4]|uniref:ABC transporter substrate-binding protein n=1 Tax=unclassified Knoellia TaxID=2618719 RepID=UPI0023DAEF8F|nr:ABC transporter substrate-binding protein [Knoellia sp. p5-6-4]MDF2145582.1 ABC transporter substrate-binding protein [Knoellia sp. p5-6-4]
MIKQLTFPSDAPNTIGGLVDYNPYSPNALTKTWLYEPLMIRNGLSCEITPWLASDFEWTDGAKGLTFTIRDGVKWSDGKPFTAKDVAFTLNLGKQYPGIDRAGLWTDTFGAAATSVTAEGNKVVIAFGGNAAPKFDELVKLQMLPEHVYGSVGDPSKYIDKKPVGTGPFTVGSYNGRRLVLQRNADYWQADKVKVQQLVLEGQYDAAQASLKLRSGQLDAYWGEIPNPKRSFVDADPKNNHFYYAPNGTTVLSPNVEKKPFDDAKFREAIAPAINRQEISDKATYGIMKPASQTGLKLPLAAKLLPEQLAKQETVTAFDAAKANQMLDAAGYKKGANGKRTTPDGQPLNLTFTVQAGWIDYQATADVIVRNLNEVGVTSKVVATAPESVDAQKKSGDYQMMLEYLHGGCEVAKNLGAKLASNQIPTKTEILPNVQRWKDPQTDATVKELSAAIDPEEQKRLVGDLVETMMTKYPVTSLVYAPARIIYRSDKAVGWPSEEDPYAQPADDRLLILTRLRAPGSDS